MSRITRLAFVLLFVFLAGYANGAEPAGSEQVNVEGEQIRKPLYKPFIERYILDELKLLRQNQQKLQAEVTEKIAAAKMDATDRSVRYVADTTNNIFYIITAAVSILVLLGWRSISDIKGSVESVTSKKVAELTLEYESRLNTLETRLKERSDQIVAAQQEISESNLIHSLWMRAGLEKSFQDKINVYDQILEINNDDVEALTYKADVLLDLDEDSWALSLVNQALDKDSDYALAYWQRACAEAKLDQTVQALADIKRAIELSGSLRGELANESYFESLKNNPEFIELTGDEHTE
jgi:tetratricopeptide (TPR) repeat protein